jgi:hypothetical protein
MVVASKFGSRISATDGRQFEVIDQGDYQSFVGVQNGDILYMDGQAVGVPQQTLLPAEPENSSPESP